MNKEAGVANPSRSSLQITHTQREATVGIFCTDYQCPHMGPRRVCLSSEPHPGKTLLLQWGQSPGFLDRIMSTMNIHTGLHPVPTGKGFYHHTINLSKQRDMGSNRDNHQPILGLGPKMERRSSSQKLFSREFALPFSRGSLSSRKLWLSLPESF